MNKLIEAQLKKTEKVDLSNFNKETNTFIIPKRKDIKLEEDKCYLIHIKDTLYTNQVLKVNWNSGSLPKYKYIKAEISKLMPKMIKVVSTAYDPNTNSDISFFWSGWLSLADIEILQRL